MFSLYVCTYLRKPNRAQTILSNPEALIPAYLTIATLEYRQTASSCCCCIAVEQTQPASKLSEYLPPLHIVLAFWRLGPIAKLG